MFVKVTVVPAQQIAGVAYINVHEIALVVDRKDGGSRVVLVGESQKNLDCTEAAYTIHERIAEAEAASMLEVDAEPLHLTDSLDDGGTDDA